MRRAGEPLKHFLAFAAALCLLAPVAEAKRRAAVGSLEIPQDPAGWLAARSYVLSTTEYPAPSFDLQPLRGIVGDARVVGLSDGTHGTHEFYTVKLRMIDFLVREMDFDVVAFEAPFPLFNRLNAYVQGGEGDPRAVLADGNDRLGYRYWDVEEMLAVVEWMRDYNAHRGTRAPVHIAGFDIYDGVAAASAVVDYLTAVDASLAADVTKRYACVTDSARSESCGRSAVTVVDTLMGRRAELEPRDSVAFEEALQNARVVAQSQSVAFLDRDPDMAANAKWLNAHRGQSGRTVLWGHSGHLAKGSDGTFFPPTICSSMYLDRVFGAEYVVIGTMTGKGSFLQWELPGAENANKSVIKTFPPPGPDSYEANFRLGPAPALLIPLKGAVPQWLAGAASYSAAGTAGGVLVNRGSLPALFDAVVYVEQSTTTRPLRR
jgi:erythromycin esterase